MSSPFPAPAAASSPYGISGGIPQLTHPSPLASTSTSTAGAGAGAGISFAPSPLTQLLASTNALSTPNPALNIAAGPGAGMGTPFLAAAPPGSAQLLSSSSPNYGFPFPIPGVTPNTSALITASLAASAATPPNLIHTHTQNQTHNANGAQALAAVGTVGEGTMADMVRALDQVDGSLERLSFLLGEIEGLEHSLFTDADAALMGLAVEQRLEHTQTLLSVMTISQNNLIGALPSSLPIPSNKNEQAPTIAPDEPATTTTTTPALQISDLTRWAGERAALEFSRREGMRAAGKAVVDILRGSTTK